MRLPPRQGVFKASRCKPASGFGHLGVWREPPGQRDGCGEAEAFPAGSHLGVGADQQSQKLGKLPCSSLGFAGVFLAPAWC